jgi:hypothetical protein
MDLDIPCLDSCQDVQNVCNTEGEGRSADKLPLITSPLLLPGYCCKNVPLRRDPLESKENLRLVKSIEGQCPYVMMAGHRALSISVKISVKKGDSCRGNESQLSYLN